MADQTSSRRNPLEAIDDIAGPLPAVILRDWLDGDATRERAAQLLEPFRVEGTVAASDSSGLSRLTRTQGVIEITAAISRMKQAVHALGMSAGGRAPGGPWVADNTEMFYDACVPVDDVLAAVLETHRRLPPDGLKVGFCIHAGEFYSIGGGLYGRDADLVELVAEEYTGGDETVITSAAVTALRSRGALILTRREDLGSLGTLFRVEAGPSWDRPVEISARSLKYPHPFSDELYDLINRMGAAASPAEADEAASLIRNQFLVTRTVVLVETGSGAMAEPVDILDSMVLAAKAGAMLSHIVPARAQIVANGRGLILLAFEDGKQALDTALALSAKLAATGKEVRAGIDRGPVLLVPHPDAWRIIGSPVNLASKLAHDLGQPGKVLMTFRAAGGVRLPPPIGRYKAKVSGVEVEGVIVNVPGARAGSVR